MRSRAWSLSLAAVLVLQVACAQLAVAGGDGGCNPILGTCTVGVGLPGNGAPGGSQGGGPGGASGGGALSDPCVHNVSSPACLDQFRCAALALGWFNNSGLRAANNLTPVELASLNADLAAQGCPPFGSTAAPPPPSPVDVARQALATIKFPRPSGHRSPRESLLYKGYPFTWVNLWTFYWTDAPTWHTLIATASLRGVSATVTATPVQLVYDPGNGSQTVDCAGPGRPWTDADGNSPPSDGACGYQYGSVTNGPITATETIVWKITWTGTGSTNGQLPQMTTSTSGPLQVMQIQVVNR